MAEKPELPAYRPHGPMPTALKGIRVADFTRVLAGPFGTQILADFGAEIVKIEQVGSGDDTRSLLPQPKLGGESFFYLSLNRNKRSIAIDLTKEEGRALALEIIAKSDVLVENFTTRVMQNFGLDYASLKERFPRLVYCSISAYGRTGRFANAGGYDSAIAIESGVASLNAVPGDAPLASGIPVIDITTAMNATIGILAALRARDLHGVGQFIDVTMYDTAIADLSYKGYQFLASGVNPIHLGRKPKFGVPGGEFECTDGTIWFTVTGNKMYRAFCTKVVEREDLIDDPRFQEVLERNKNSEILFDLLVPIFKTQPREFWRDRLRAAAIPCGMVRLIGEALMSRETADRDMIYEIAHPTAGKIPQIAQPIKMSHTPAVDPTPPPLLGQHSAEILREVLGYDDGKIAALKKAGAIQLLESEEPSTLRAAAS